MGRPRILLVSTYELGHQPLLLASPAAALRGAGYEVASCDTSVESLEDSAIAMASLVAISVPMHTAARLGIEVARRVRRTNPDALVAFYGLYAAPLATTLAESRIADAFVLGESEPGLVSLANDVAAGSAPKPVYSSFARLEHPIPDRRGLPPLDQYARLSEDGDLRLAGYVEGSRGCAHTCAHCPITPVYGGRLRLVRPAAVLADVDQQVAMGARHITFGDPDFLNAVPHSLAIAGELHHRYPALTFDATIKVEHLLEHAGLLPRLRELGCLFITSAFESTSARILKRLQKGHTRADMERALELADRAGIAIRPTWVAFAPWTTARDYLDLLAFIEEHDLVGATQPVQLELRLLLPPGSPLIRTAEADSLLRGFDAEGLTFRWANPDERMDDLQRQVSAIVEGAACEGEAAELTFARVRRAAWQLLEGKGPPPMPVRRPRQVPGLTEAWFC